MDAAVGVAYAARPDSLLSLRACVACRLVKTLNQFQDSFCENCWHDWADGATPGSLKKTRCMDLAMENTTADFEGMTSMMRPFDSWVGKWLKMSACPCHAACRHACTHVHTHTHSAGPLSPLHARIVNPPAPP